jgi:hypothetical protein
MFFRHIITRTDLKGHGGADTQLKHLLGHKFADPHLQADLHNLPFKVTEGLMVFLWCMSTNKAKRGAPHIHNCLPWFCLT